MNLNELASMCHNLAVNKGFWDGDDEERIPAALLEIHSEVAELADLYKKRKELSSGKVFSVTGAEEELADIIIRCLDFAGAFGMDIKNAVERKLEYNSSRPFMHGDNRW